MFDDVLVGVDVLTQPVLVGVDVLTQGALVGLDTHLELGCGLRDYQRSQEAHSAERDDDSEQTASSKGTTHDASTHSGDCCLHGSPPVVCGGLHATKSGLFGYAPSWAFEE